MITEDIREHSDMGEEKLKIVEEIMQKAPEGTFCEVGVRRGGTSALALLQPNCTNLVCIDPYIPFKDLNGKDIEMKDSFYTDAIDILERVKGEKKYHFSKTTSKDFIDLKFYLGEYAFVLLDGDHTDETVGMEIDYFSEHMVEGGIIYVDNIDWLTIDLSRWEQPRYDIAYKIFRK